MKAIIMAGGEGTRLRPLTCNTPKPLLKVANRPVIDYTVDLLKSHGINEIGVTLQYLPKKITDYLSAKGDIDTHFEYFIERTPLGTAGSVKNCSDFVDDTFLVMSGDGLTDIDLTKAIEAHKKNNADVTIVLKRVDNPVEYGIVITDESGNIVRFAEKPSWSEVFSDTVNTGIYIINKNVLNLVEENKPTDFSTDLFPLMLSNGMKLFGYITDGYWCDIGNMRSYVKANIDAISGKVKCVNLTDYYEVKKGVFVGKFVKLDRTAELYAPCIIGKETNIRQNTIIYPNTVIGEGCFVGKFSTVKNSVIQNNVYLGNDCQVRGAVIADNCTVGDSVDIFENSAIGNGTKIGDLSEVRNGASVWPEKQIEDGSCITENVIWQTEKYARYFDKEKISGKLNIDVTPEFAALCGKAFADRTNDRIIVAHNGTPASEMLYNAVLSGLMSSGETVLELKATPLPTARYGVRLFSAGGGIYVGEDNQNVSIYFIDGNGSNLASREERSIENLLNSKSFRKNGSSSITTPQNFAKCCDFYERHIVNCVRNSLPSEKELKVRVINNGSIESKVFIAVLAELGIRQSVIYADELDKLTSDDYALTAELSDFGEKLVLYNETSKHYDTNEMNLLMNYISVGNNKDEGYIIADYNAPEAVDEIAKEQNGVIVRTKSGTRALINEIVKHDGIEDTLPIGRMSMYYDGIMFFLQIYSYLSKSNKSLKSIISVLPTLYISEKEVQCPWEKRSKILRRLADNTDKSFDGSGIKIREKYGWTLVLPDAKRAVFKVYSQGFSNEYAEELTDICTKKINEYKEE